MPTDRCLHCHATLPADSVRQGMPFCSREHRELYRLLHDREPEPAPVRVRSISSLTGGDSPSAPLPPRATTRNPEASKPFADGNCQFCGKTLPIFARLRGVRFCSSDHETNFHQRQTQETLERLAAGQRKQVNPGSVRIRQRTKPPQAQPTVLHQPQVAPAALRWQMVDLSRRAAVPSWSTPVQGRPPVWPTPRKSYLRTSPGIWPALPDCQEPPHWHLPTLATSLPVQSMPAIRPARPGRQSQVQLPTPPALSVSAVAFNTAAFVPSVHPVRQVAGPPARPIFTILPPTSCQAFQHWTSAPLALPVAPQAALPAGHAWRAAAVDPLDISSAQRQTLPTGTPSRSAAQSLRPPAPARHHVPVEDWTTAPGWVAPATVATPHFPPALAPQPAAWQPVHSQPFTIHQQVQSQPVSWPSAADWNSLDFIPQLQVAAVPAGQQAARPAASGFLACAKPWIAPPPVQASANWASGTEGSPFTALQAIGHNTPSELAAISQPAVQPLPRLRTAAPLAFITNWTLVSPVPRSAATAPLVQPASRPNRAAALVPRLNPLITEPRRRTRPPLERLRMPAIGSAFTAAL